MEFKFMCGENVIEKIIHNWNQYFPAILRFGGKEVPEMLTESCMYSALEITDKAFRSSGVTAKSDPIFTIHEVCINTS